MNRVIPKFQKKFAEFYNVPKRCDICGDFQDPADNDSFLFLFRCSNRHMFCPNHLELFIQSNLADVRAFCQKTHSDWFKEVESLSDTDFWREFLCLYHLDPNSIEQLKMQTEQLFYEDCEEKTRVKNKQKINPIFCPICMFRVAPEKELLKYLLDRWNLNKNDIVTQLRSQYSNLEMLNKEYLTFFKDSTPSGEEKP